VPMQHGPCRSAPRDKCVAMLDRLAEELRGERLHALPVGIGPFSDGAGLKHAHDNSRLVRRSSSPISPFSAFLDIGTKMRMTVSPRFTCRPSRCQVR
jgi:hypothetical protein